MQREVQPINGNDLPEGVILILEMMKAGNPSDWLDIINKFYETKFVKKFTKWKKLAKVTEQFPTMRKMLQAINVDYFQHCTNHVFK